MTATTTQRPHGRRHTIRLFTGRVTLRIHSRTSVFCLIAAALSLMLLAVSLSVGAYPITPAEVLRAVFHGEGERLAIHFVNQERLPQALLAIVGGGALGLSGAIFQVLARNPLASPDIIGFTSGAATGAITAIVLLGSATATVAAGAIGGGLATAALVYLLSRRNGVNGIRLVLVGLGVTAVLGSLNSYLLTRASLNTAQNAHVWLIGTLGGRSWNEAGMLIACAVVLIPVTLLFGRQLRMLELGDELPASLGLPLERTRLILIILGVSLCAVTVASMGPIPFVALVAPQVAIAVTCSPGQSMIASALAGSVLLAAAHLVSGQLYAAVAWLGRQLPWSSALSEADGHTQLPVGAACAVLGGGYLAVLLFRRWRTN